jgi:hypothetical protein
MHNFLLLSLSDSSRSHHKTRPFHFHAMLLVKISFSFRNWSFCVITLLSPHHFLFKQIMAPRSTRTTAVLDLLGEYPIYIYDSPVRYPFASVVKTPVPRTPKYSTKQFSSISLSSTTYCSVEGSDAIFLRVCFWSDEHPDPIFSVNVAVPPGWSPRMYLGALRVTIWKHLVVISAPKRILGSTYATLNFVHHMFGFSRSRAISILYGENAFRSVFGGEFD